MLCGQEVLNVRVALIIQKLDVPCGGRERLTAQTALGLAKRGHEVDILCVMGKPLAPSVRVTPLGSGASTRAGKLLGFVRRVGAHLAAERYDITHAMLPVPGADIYQLHSGTVPALKAATLRQFGLLGRAACACAWAMDLARLTMSRLERQVAASQTWCLPVSRMVAEELNRYYGRTDRVRVVFNAVDAPAVSEERRAQMREQTRRQLGVKDDDLLLVCPGSNMKRKGVLEAIAGLSEYGRRQPRRRAVLAVVGVHLAEGYRRIAAARGVHAMFLPPTDDIWSMYAAADGVILLSRYDPCSLVVLEGAAFGTPCITTAHNGAAEVLRDGAGVVVDDARDRREVASAVATLADGARHATMVEACRRAKPLLLFDRYLDDLEAVYKEIAAR